MKKVFLSVIMLLSFSSIASVYNCKSVNTEYYDLDLKITTTGASALVFNNKVKENDQCKSASPESGITIISCEKIQIIITNKQVDLEGGNTMFQTINGMRGILDCK